jgi:hypothetical protein
MGVGVKSHLGNGQKSEVHRHVSKEQYIVRATVRLSTLRVLRAHSITLSAILGTVPGHALGWVNSRKANEKRTKSEKRMQSGCKADARRLQLTKADT